MLTLKVPVTADKMVIDHAHSLHEGITDCTAKKSKASLAHVGTNFV